MLTLTSGAGDDADAPARQPPKPSEGPLWCAVCGKSSSGASEDSDTRRCPYCQNKLTFRFPPRA